MILVLILAVLADGGTAPRLGAPPGTRLTADFDGDGALDEAQLRVMRDPDSKSARRPRLLVRFAGAPPQTVWAPSREAFALFEDDRLTLAAAGDLDGAPGAELVLLVDRHANVVDVLETTVLSVRRRGATMLGTVPVGPVVRVEDGRLFTSGLLESSPFDCFRRQRWARFTVRRGALAYGEGGRMPPSNAVHLLQDAVTHRSRRSELLERVVALPVPTTNDQRCADTLRFTQQLAVLLQLRIAEESGTSAAQPFFLHALQLASGDEMGRAFTAAANALFDDTEPLAARLEIVEALLRDFNSEEGLNEVLSLLTAQRARP
ncbi:MAG: hypothetical protein JNG84_04500 [Archangium sp.]|nr:hypothetical protein [Archangium sp.]